MRTQGGRGCSRAGCKSHATMTLTYVYAESTAVVGPLATYSEPHAYDLCVVHGTRLKVPHGWRVIKQELDGTLQGPNLLLYEQCKKHSIDSKIICSGGISSLNDLQKLRDLSMYAAVAGKSLLEQKITDKEIIKFLQEE